MTLYRPPLLQKSKKDINIQPEIKDALKGFEHSYLYTVGRIGNGGNIELDVCTIVMDSEENLYLRMGHYSGQKEPGKKL